ncbi:hypothetical protein [Methylobacterium mesophilicum]|uniref:hypothetical protein n=1 Tax=Methylobacterium mesophilicum TaxID=39956 RepID=UPI0002C604D3|nr:hypothetical protein [Methylobacterium mesophilicum]
MTCPIRVHGPSRLATPGMGRATMGRDTIAAFCADPVKRDCGLRSLRASLDADGLAQGP